MARRLARRQGDTAGKSAASARDPAKEKAATTQSHRFARHQFLNAGNERWRKIGAHDRLEALSRLTLGIGSGADAVSKAMESPTAEDDVKGLKRTLKRQKKQVQVDLGERCQAQRLRPAARPQRLKAKSSLATAEEKLAAAETMLKNAREFQRHDRG